MIQDSFDKVDYLREFLFTIIESLPNGILLADRSGLILAANQKAGTILGLRGTSVLQRSCWDIIRQATGAREDELAALQIPKGRILVETTGSRHDGESRYLSISRNDLKSPFLHISGFFLSFEDITYPAMIASQHDRQRRFAAMQDMAVRMSQDLKNPLGSLALYASILNRELKDDPDNERVTSQMISAVHTMDHLLDNYVTFASLPEPRYAKVNVRRWLEQTVDQLQLLDAAEDINISCDYRHLVEDIFGDPDLLRQLSLNIGINALESMVAGQELKLRTRIHTATEEQPGFLEVSFIDEGKGIPEKDLPKIFDPFFTTKDHANGLGLAIVHYIVEAHHGLVQVQSHQGSGTVFSVLLPCGKKVFNAIAGKVIEPE